MPVTSRDMPRLLRAARAWALAALPLLGCAAQALGAAPGATDPPPGRWTSEKASAWYEAVFPIRGCNYLPRTAVNSTEMWQAETFDLHTIDEELGWAARAGYNAVRVFLPYTVWKAGPAAFEGRVEDFLAVAERRGIRAAPIFFCDCAFAGREPTLGKQDDPVPGVHNSGWTPSPGLKLVTDRAAWPDLERYVVAVTRRFAGDRRVLLWDLYNEPGNSGLGAKSLPLAEAAFAWARSAQPTQPLTTGAWVDLESPMSQRLLELSDIPSFHGYDPPDGIRAKIDVCERLGRPVLCTEWLHRQSGNTFAAILPIFAERRVGWFHWGLVAGRTQTYMHWGSAPGTPTPKVWQHDVFHPDGRAWDLDELDWVRGFPRGKEAGLLPTSDLWVRDPFVVPTREDRAYWMVGTSGFRGFHAWRSLDLKRWSGPLVVFRGAPDFWADRDYWAPEIHEHRGRFYLFGSFKAEGRSRGTQILVAETVAGPYAPWSEGPVTPPDWECLDGTLHVDDAGTPWIVFCHEWLQVKDGEICALQLSPDLKAPRGKPSLLFRASEAPWVEPIRDDGSRVTDGPFLYRAADGSLLLLWSSFTKGKYALGLARSAGGCVLGPWTQEEAPIHEEDGGHGMLFRAFDGTLVLALHRPNGGGKERLRLFRIREAGGRLTIGDAYPNL